MTIYIKSETSMRKPIKITVKGTDHRGDDAPTVEDLLAQIEDFVFVLRSVEGAIAEDHKESIVWCVTDASKNSPLTIEVTPYPKTYAMNIDNRADQVAAVTAKGINELSTTGRRPIYFDDRAVARAEKLFDRVTNGIANTKFDFSAYDNTPNIEVTPQIARATLERIAETAMPKAVPYKELGSIEGFINKVELDGFGRPIVWLRSRLDGQRIKCISSENGLDRIGHFEVEEVLSGLRVRVHGLINYRDINRISTIDVTGVHVFDDDKNLPGYESIVAPNFTNGIESITYLEALRDIKKNKMELILKEIKKMGVLKFIAGTFLLSCYFIILLIVLILGGGMI